jgi:uncharacterized protein (AIM24 family)
VRHEIQYQPSHALAIVHLDDGEHFPAEAGALVSMDEAIEIETRATGGMCAALRRSVLGGEC